VNLKEILFQRARNQKKLCKSMELCQVGRYAESIRLETKADEIRDEVTKICKKYPLYE